MVTMDYECKRLTSEDIHLLKELMSVFGDAFCEVETYEGATPSDEYLAKLLSKDDFIALVATHEGKVVGGLAAYVLQKFEQERSEVYIYDLAVLDAHRRKGIATTLIQALKPIAKALGAYVIYVQADKEDDGAIKLYESLGSKADVYHFDIEV